MNPNDACAPTDKATRQTKRLGTTGLAIGLLSILACELPILLALLGFTGLSAVASTYTLPPAVEMVGITLGGIGLALLLGVVGYRAFTRSHS